MVVIFRSVLGTWEVPKCDEFGSAELDNLAATHVSDSLKSSWHGDLDLAICYNDRGLSGQCADATQSGLHELHVMRERPAGRVMCRDRRRPPDFEDISTSWAAESPC